MTAGILNAPDSTFNPASDPYLAETYGPEDPLGPKAANKVALQKALGLIEDPEAPLLFWPSRLDPCGLPQMIGAIYGAPPIAHEVGGLRDTVRHLNPEQHAGNGFLFKTYDSGGLFWAIQQAMSFYHLPVHARSDQISRIMTEGTGTFNHKMTARHYIDLYHKLLRDPVVERMEEESRIL